MPPGCPQRRDRQSATFDAPHRFGVHEREDAGRALAVAIIALAASAPPASAAFPGADGQLAVTPVSAAASSSPRPRRAARRAGATRHSGVPCQELPCDLSSLAVNRDGFAAWDAVARAETPEPNITAISCPAADLCVAGDARGDILVSTTPSGGRPAWGRVFLGAGFGSVASISCPPPRSASR